MSKTLYSVLSSCEKSRWYKLQAQKKKALSVPRTHKRNVPNTAAINPGCCPSLGRDPSLTSIRTFIWQTHQAQETAPCLRPFSRGQAHKETSHRGPWYPNTRSAGWSLSPPPHSVFRRLLPQTCESTFTPKRAAAPRQKNMRASFVLLQ